MTLGLRARGLQKMGNTMARVLIVDDSPTEMYKLTGMLEKHGHQVLKAENGADGVALARQEKPDAVLMDIVMPGLRPLAN
jgi:twitching motility two-component system response regulator PilH